MKTTITVALSLLCASTTFAAPPIYNVRAAGDFKVDGTLYLKDGTPIVSSDGLLKNRGTFAPATDYFVGDVVQSGGASYVCKAANQSQPLTNDGTYWAVMATQGANGNTSLISTQGFTVGNLACPAGGTIMSSGPDSNNNGILDPNEITQTQLICNGATGTKGDTGSIGPVGPPGMTWLGSWQNTTPYIQHDTVSYNGSSYICISNNTGSQPDISPATWSVVAQKGDSSALFPRIATSASGASVTLGSACSNYLSVSIAVPGPGNIDVGASSIISISHTSGTDDIARVFIGSTNTDCPGSGDGASYHQVPATAETSFVYFTATPRSVITVGAAGTYTYYLNGNMFHGQDANDTFSRGRMFATWYPN